MSVIIKFLNADDYLGKSMMTLKNISHVKKYNVIPDEKMNHHHRPAAARDAGK